MVRAARAVTSWAFWDASCFSIPTRRSAHFTESKASGLRPRIRGRARRSSPPRGEAWNRALWLGIAPLKQSLRCAPESPAHSVVVCLLGSRLLYEP